jgi:hypothetical protein
MSGMVLLTLTFGIEIIIMVFNKGVSGMNDKDEKIIPPYVSYKTLINFLDNLKSQAIPTRLDRSVKIFQSMSGAVQGQLKLALTYLNLITENGDTTSALEKLVHSEGIQREQTLKDVLIPAYPFIFENGLELDRATHRQLEECFSSKGATGDTLRKCIAFFLNAAKDAGIKLSPHFKKVRSQRLGATKPKRTLQQKSTVTVQEPTISPKVAMPPLDTALEKMILAKMPDFNPDWSEEAQKSWLDAINKLIDRFQKNSGN